VKFLLDENFPLHLYHRLKSSGYDVEHIIVLGQRGLTDPAIVGRLVREDLVFLTCDVEFLFPPVGLRSTIMVSRVSQSLPIARRVEIWFWRAGRVSQPASRGQGLRVARRHAAAFLFPHSQFAMQLSPIFLLDRGDPHDAPYSRLSRMVPYKHRHEFPGI